MSRARQAVLVLIGIERPAAVRLMARLSDPVLWHIGRELMQLDPRSVTRRETETAIRSLMGELAESSNSVAAIATTIAGESPPDARPPLLTQQECTVIATVLSGDKPEIAAVVLHRLPTPLVTRILLSMRPTIRSDLIERFRRLGRPPRELQSRLLVDLAARIPARPFPALAARFGRVAGIALPSGNTPAGTNQESS